MLTIGYGDLVPTNIKEKSMFLGISYFSCGVYAYCIGNIGIIFGEMNKDKLIFT